MSIMNKLAIGLEKTPVLVARQPIPVRAPALRPSKTLPKGRSLSQGRGRLQSTFRPVSPSNAKNKLTRCNACTSRSSSRVAIFSSRSYGSVFKPIFSSGLDFVSVSGHELDPSIKVLKNVVVKT